MNWIEVIWVRFAGSHLKTIESKLYKLMIDVDRKGRSGRIRIYNREKIETDICIVLFHDMEKVKTGGSRLGLRFVAALKDFGLVNHTVWAELDHSKHNPRI